MRISGPNFFGFSDITTQQALAMALYNEQELAQALQVRAWGLAGCRSRAKRLQGDPSNPRPAARGWLAGWRRWLC
jgi:hypothetical protein